MTGQRPDLIRLVLSGLVEERVNVGGKQRRYIEIEIGRIACQQFVVSLADPLSDVLGEPALIRPMLYTAWPVNLSVRIFHAARLPSQRTHFSEHAAAAWISFLAKCVQVRDRRG